jgi:hypothetical protein
MPKTYIYSRRKVRCKGKKDGRNWYWKLWPLQKGAKESAPLTNQQEPAAYETELKNLGEAEITQLSAAWEKEDKTLMTKYCQYLAERDSLTKKSQTESTETTKAKERMLKAKDELDKFEKPSMSPATEIMLLIFFLIVEIPFNSIIFSIFGAGKTETLIMAAGTAFVISTLAFIMGLKLKIHPKSITDKIILVLIPVVAVGVLTAVSVLRAKMFGTIQQFEIIKINLDPNTAAIIFVAINLALFVAAMMVTYAATRPDHKKYKSQLSKFNDAKDMYRQELRKSENSEDDLAEAEEKLAEARHKREKTFALYCEMAANTADDVEWLIGVYRSANMEARIDARMPECFKKPPPEIFIPENLKEKNISWDCGQVKTPHSQTT